MIDHLIVGGGISGTLLAHALRHRVAAGERLVVVDHDPRPDDRTFAFWIEGPSPFDEVLLAEWSALRVRDEARDVRVELGAWRYCALSEAALREWVWTQLGPSAERRRAHVERIEDGKDLAVAHLEGAALAATWIYESRPIDAPGFAESFEGAWVEVDENLFDVSEAVLMDFRAPQHDGLGFFYVLPVTPRRAMVMGVQMGPTVVVPDVEAHLARLFGDHPWRIHHREGGVIPLTDAPFDRHGQHVLRIRIPGGMIRPSTGYALTRILRDTRAVADSLARQEHPHDVPVDPWRVPSATCSGSWRACRRGASSTPWPGGSWGAEPVVVPRGERARAEPFRCARRGQIDALTTGAPAPDGASGVRWTSSSQTATLTRSCPIGELPTL